MKTIMSGDKEMLIASAIELRTPEVFVALAAKIEANHSVVVDDFSLHKAPKSNVISMVAGGKEFAYKKSAKEVLQAILDYKTVDRVSAILMA
jgi:hypothetical protein